MAKAADLLSITADVSGLNDRMREYARRMGELPEDVVRTQVGLLMRELADASAPKSRTALEKSIGKDLARVYAPRPSKMLPLSHQRGKGFVWLMAMPDRLIGVKEQNYHPDDTVDDLKRLYHKTREAGVIKGPKTIDMGARLLNRSIVGIPGRKGVRAHQHVQELNRIVVRRGVYDQFKTWLKGRGGILGGSWAVAWNHLNPKGRPPQAYKFRHVGDGTARGTFVDGLGIPGKATFTLINRATGVENESQLKMVGAALRYRTRMLMNDLANQLRGAYKKSLKR